MLTFVVKLILGLVGVCLHDSTYRERRCVPGAKRPVERLFYVCEDCGRAWPVIVRDRSDAERLKTLNRKIDRARSGLAERKTEKVTPIRRRAAR